MHTSTRNCTGEKLTPGYNVDAVDLTRGLEMAADIGYDDPTSRMVIEYALAHAIAAKAPVAR